MREKMIQIPQSLFVEITKLILSRHNLDPDELEKQLQDIERGVMQKFDRMTKHDLYSVYKTEADPVKREQARRDYLRKAGIPEDYIWTENWDGK